MLLILRIFHSLAGFLNVVHAVIGALVITWSRCAANKLKQRAATRAGR